MAEVILSTCVLIGMILIFRRIADDRVSPNIIYGVWLLVAVRILVPVPVSQFLPEYKPQITKIAQGEWKLDENEIAAGRLDKAEVPAADENMADKAGMMSDKISVPDKIGVSPDKINMTDKTEMSPDSEIISDKAGTSANGRTFFIVWLAGVMTVAFVLVFKNMNFAAKLKKERVYFKRVGKYSVYAADGVGAPFVFGVLRPVIYIDSQSLYDEKLLGYVLDHEFGHIKHRDHWWLFVRWLCVCFQWFNPFVWAAAVISAKDAEIACDYHVICQKDEDGRLGYGHSLIRLASTQKNERHSALCSPALPFHRPFLKKRITKIGSFSIIKRSRNLGAVMIAAVIFAAAIVGCDRSSAGNTQNAAESEKSAGAVSLTRDKRAAVVTEGDIWLEAIGYLPTDAYGNAVLPWQDGFYIDSSNFPQRGVRENVYIDLKEKRVAVIDVLETKTQPGVWADHRYFIDGKLYTYGTEKSGRTAMYVSAPDGSQRQRFCYFDEDTVPYKAWVFMAYDKTNHDIYYFAEKLEKGDVSFDKDHRYIIRMNMDTKKQEIAAKVRADIDMSRYGAAGDNIFYMKDGKIEAFNITDGKQQTFELPNMSEYFYKAWRIWDNKLYYMGKDNNTVLCMDLTTGEEAFVGKIIESGDDAVQAMLTDYMWDGKFVFYVINDTTGERYYTAMPPKGGEKMVCRKITGIKESTDIVAESEEDFVILKKETDSDGGSESLSYQVIDKDDYWNGRYECAKTL